MSIQYAVVYGPGPRLAEVVGRYLPTNYETIPSTLTTTPDDRQRIGIKGEDVAGWTLDEYVIPRLRSGNFAVERCTTLDHVRERTQGVMN